MKKLSARESAVRNCCLSKQTKKTLELKLRAKGFSEEEKFDDATVKKMLYPALTSIATGVITKIVTKKASYKAVDIFNGVARKTLKDILSVGPASSNYGVGVYVQL